MGFLLRPVQNRLSYICLGAGSWYAETARVLALIFVLIVGAIVIISNIKIPLGLDLQGGSQLTIQVKPTAEIKQITQKQLEDVQKVIENRVNGLGVSRTCSSNGRAKSNFSATARSK